MSYKPQGVVENALIESTMLGYEDHGILTCWLVLKMRSSGQGFGGYAFDTPNGKDGSEFQRVGCAFGMEFVARTLKTVGVDHWEKLPGKHLRIDHSHSAVFAIGHIIEDHWFDPKADLNFLKEAALA